MAISQHLSRAPNCTSTAKRYKTDGDLYKASLWSRGVKTDTFDPSTPRPSNQHPVVILLALIWLRCGPKHLGCEGLKAKSTGMNVKSAGVAFWKTILGCEQGYTDLGEGRFRGNPGQDPEVKSLLDTLIAAQADAKSHVTRYAVVETQEDVRELYRKFVKVPMEQIVVYRRAVSQEALMFLLVCVFNILQWCTAARADELLHLCFEDLIFAA